jgi:hypothetical protein
MLHNNPSFSALHHYSSLFWGVGREASPDILNPWNWAWGLKLQLLKEAERTPSLFFPEKNTNALSCVKVV